MARILYGVSGQGFGHASRADSVARGLLARGHDVQFVTSRQSTEALKPRFGDRVHDTFGLRLCLNSGRVTAVGTVLANLVDGFFGGGLRRNRITLDGLFRNFKPDLVLSDFEPFTALWARKYGVPAVGLDHQHLISHGRVEVPAGMRWSYLTALLVIRLWQLQAKRFLITNFFRVPIRNQPARMVPPVLRDAVYRVVPVAGGHVVAYITEGCDPEPFVAAFRALPDTEFRCYGFGRAGREKNVVFLPASVDGFLADVGSAAAVIASAGYNLITECMHFRKPMLLAPIPGQFEQQINAYYVAKLGLGRSVEAVTPQVIKRFLGDLPRFRNVLERHPDPARLDAVLDAVESELPRPLRGRFGRDAGGDPPCGRSWSRDPVVA
jgi:uncharacterized protein (TIGR00661 family)